MPPQRLQGIRAEPDPARRRALAAALLTATATRAELSTGLEVLVATVEDPTDDERAALRLAFARLGEPGLDRSGVLRTHVVRLLGRDPDPADRDLLVEAARTFCQDTGVDTSAELRGLGLRALAQVDPAVARWIAAERIHDPEPPNQEPHRTALRILAENGDHLLIRAWLDGGRQTPRPVDVAAAAEAELAAVMPASEWALRAPARLGDERPVETITAAEAVVAVPRADLARPLAALLAGIDDEDLFRAVAMTLAAARDGGFADSLLEVVDRVPIPLLDAYTDALSICRSAGRDRALDRVSARAREAHSRGRDEEA